MVCAPSCTTCSGSYQCSRKKRAAGANGSAKTCSSSPGQAKRSIACSLSLDGGDLGGKVIQLLASALAGQSRGRWQHQAVKLVGIDQRQAGQHPGVDPVTFGMT